SSSCAPRPRHRRSHGGDGRRIRLRRGRYAQHPPSSAQRAPEDPLKAPPAFTVAARPALVSDPVLAPQGLPTGDHHDPAVKASFGAMGEAVGRMRGTSDDIVLMQGEAVLGLEAALAGTVRPGMTVINVASGPYGQGMGSWLDAMGAVTVSVETGFREVPTEA